MARKRKANSRERDSWQPPWPGQTAVAKRQQVSPFTRKNLVRGRVSVATHYKLLTAPDYSKGYFVAGAVTDYVRTMHDPGSAHLRRAHFDSFEIMLARAAIDDEPFTEEDRSASDAGWTDYLSGKTTPLEDFSVGMPSILHEADGPKSEV